jgi:hypothetical protein
MTDADALRIGWTRGEAESRRRTYRGLLLAVLIVQAAAGVIALIWPACVSDWLGVPSLPPNAWLRALGMLMVFTAVFCVPGYINPVFARYPNVVGIMEHFAFAILYFCFGGGFLLIAAYELIVALALAVTYQRLIGAELMSRP